MNDNSQRHIGLSNEWIGDAVLSFLEDIAPCIEDIARRDRNLADQLKRAATSVALNLAEGARLQTGNRRKHYLIALGSAGEARKALRIAAIWRYIAADRAAALDAKLDRILARIYGLAHKR